MERYRRSVDQYPGSPGRTLLLVGLLAIAASIAGPLHARTSHSLVLLVAADQLQSHRNAVLGSLPKLVGLLSPGDRFGAVVYSDVIEHVTPLATLSAQTLPDLKAALQRTMSANGVNGAVGFERALAALDGHPDTTGNGTRGTDAATLIGFSSLAITGQEPEVTRQFESWLEVSLMNQAMDRQLRVLLLSGSPVSSTIHTLVTGTLQGRIVDLASDAATLTPVLREYAAAPAAAPSRTSTHASSQTPTPTPAQPAAPPVTATAATPGTSAIEPANADQLASVEGLPATQPAVKFASSPGLQETNPAISDIPESTPDQPPTPIVIPPHQSTLALLSALATIAGMLIIGGLVYTRHKHRRLALEQTAQLRAQQLGHGYRIPDRSARPQATAMDETLIDKTEVLLPQRISDDSFEFMAEALNQTGRRP